MTDDRYNFDCIDPADDPITSSDEEGDNLARIFIVALIAIGFVVAVSPTIW